MNFVDDFINNHQPKRVVVNGEQKEYLVGGKSKTVFLIFPGSGQDALSCYDLIDVFEKTYKTIALNYDKFYSIDSFFDYVNEILELEKAENIILYGLSLGGFLAQHYVRKYGDKVSRLIISQAGTTKSKTIIRRVVIPGKILYRFIPFIPQRLLNKFFKPIAGRVQSGQANIISLYKKYSSKENLDRRIEFAKRTTFSMIDKNYLKTVYSLGMDMEKLEKKFNPNDLKGWKGKILIIRTDNDPIAQDNGVFKQYYPQAQVVTFHNTGHLTPFIQFEKMVEEIKSFLSEN